MTLLRSMEKEGNYLFKYRGQFPVILFVLSLPFIYMTDYGSITSEQQNYCMYAAVILSAFGFLLRFYTIGTTPKGTSGRNTKEQVAYVLNSTGMYSMVRHPLYLANYFIWLGIAVSTFSGYFIIVMSLLFWIYYERIMFAEERFLEGRFGNEYLDWANSLPAFIPSVLKFKRSSISFSVISVLRREYASFLAAVIGFVFIELFRNYFTHDKWVISNFTLEFLIASLVLVLILRSIKHYTKFFNEKERS